MCTLQTGYFASLLITLCVRALVTLPHRDILRKIFVVHLFTAKMSKSNVPLTWLYRQVKLLVHMLLHVKLLFICFYRNMSFFFLGILLINQIN